MAENKCDKLFGKNGELVEFRKKQVLEGVFWVYVTLAVQETLMMKCMRGNCWSPEDVTIRVGVPRCLECGRKLNLESDGR